MKTNNAQETITRLSCSHRLHTLTSDPTDPSSISSVCASDVRMNVPDPQPLLLYNQQQQPEPVAQESGNV